MKGIIIFIDIKNSILLFNKYSLLFFKIIKKLNLIIHTFLKKSNGTLIKKLRDGYMIFFKNSQCLQSIIFIIELQKYLQNKKINIKGDRIYIRIGLSVGDMIKYKEKVQNSTLIDYYGNNVNIASRMESSISPIGGFALHNFSYEKIKEKIPKELRLYIKNNYNIKIKKNVKLNNLKCKNKVKHFNNIKLNQIIIFYPK